MDPDAFYGLLVKELTTDLLGLDKLHCTALAVYYPNIVHHPKRLKFYQYNWSRRVEPMVRLLRSLPTRDRPYRLLDAGCGVGTESIFFSLCRSDVEITGSDIREETRLRAAKLRKTAYEAHLDRGLSIRFTNQDVFELLRSQHYDLIWSMESISHIDPAEKFIEDAFRSLEGGGSLVISDSNKKNPAVWLHSLKHQWKGGSRVIRTVVGKDSTPYARERVVSVPHLVSLLEAAGFRQIKSQLSIYCPPFLAFLVKDMRRWDLGWSRRRLLRDWGGIYTITASKP
jgi:2-polyprenyl-3-methyl-5-hydroxy-6-metoxy-1,4-benzoquinol methylase